MLSWPVAHPPAPEEAHMDRVAALESEVDSLRKRVEVTRHVAEDMRTFVSADPELVSWWSTTCSHTGRS